MIVLSPFSRINLFEIEKYFSIEKYLMDRNINTEFNTKQKIYYNLIRPIIPLKLRQRIQRQLCSSINCRKYFINEEFINFIHSSPLLKESFDKLYPNDKKTAILLTHDIEDEIGLKSVPKIIELEQKYGFTSSWNIVPYKYKIDEGIIKYINITKNEIGIHGYNHDGRLFSSYNEFHRRALKINLAIKKYNAIGFRSPMMHRNLKWQQELDIFYDSSTFDYDPYQPFPGGVGYIWPFIAGKFVELPYTIPQDHTLFYELKERSIEIWRKKIEWLVKNNGMILVLTHPDYLIENNHMKYYEELLEYLNEIENAWYCLPGEMTQWWRQRSIIDEEKISRNYDYSMPS